MAENERVQQSPRKKGYKRITEHRSSNCVKGPWPEIDPQTGEKIFVPYDEMIRLTLQRQLGTDLPRPEFEELTYDAFYTPDPDKKRRGGSVHGIPGTLTIDYKRRI